MCLKRQDLIGCTCCDLVHEEQHRVLVIVSVLALIVRRLVPVVAAVLVVPGIVAALVPLSNRVAVHKGFDLT